MSTQRATRDRLLAAATELLCRSGYRNLGVSELLAMADATAGSLYHHFPDGKAEVAAAAIAEAGSTLRTMLLGLLGSVEPPAQAVRLFFDAAGQRLEDSGWQLGCPVGTPAADGLADGGIVATAIRASLEGWVEAIAGALTQRGADRNAAMPLAEWAVASYEGALLLARARRDRGVLRVAGDQVAAAVERALAAPAAGQSGL